MFTIKVSGQVLEFSEKITLLELAKKIDSRGFVATVNNRLRELGYYLNYDAEVEFLSFDSFDAVRAYETSLRYIISMAIKRLYPDARVIFHQCISRSLACSVENLGRPLDVLFLQSLEAELQKLIKADLPITRRKVSKEEAIAFYEQEGFLDKVAVLKYRPEDTVNLYECDGYKNYMFGYMVPSTGYLTEYGLILYYPNFLVRYPRAECGGKIPKVFDDSPAFGKMINEAQEWSEMIGADQIAKINEQVLADNGRDLVNLCETKHNNMLAELGNKINENINMLRLIAISGPSSSGKTTFSNRLRIELMTRGIRPVKISIDDYYLPRAEAPKDEHGQPDLEHIHALDVERFNEDLLQLIQGQEVTLPKFNFKLGTREKGETIKVGRRQPIIIEGIHALNEELTASIPKHQKFKIYISPIPQINIDNLSPISATDVRILRRIVRDSKYRKTPVEETLKMWPSVRRGEFRWIYPYQEEADYVYNTELTYELCVLKKYALPSLEKVGRDSEYFIPANRLVKFLKYFQDIEDRYVPSNSILREFIGGSGYYE